MTSRQINVSVGFKISVGYGYVRYEVTEMMDLDEADDRDQVLRDKRVELITHVYDHVTKMRDRLAQDDAARGKE